MKKHKVVIEFEREDDMKWFIESIDEARKVYVQSGARVGGVFAGIILDRVGQSLGVHRFETEPDELTIAYMSIETMKARITELESEVERLKASANKPHPCSDGWSGDDNTEYTRGFRGHGY